MGHYGSEMEPERERLSAAEWAVDVVDVKLTVVRSAKPSEYGRYRCALLLGEEEVTWTWAGHDATYEMVARDLMRQWLR